MYGWSAKENLLLHKNSLFTNATFHSNSKAKFWACLQIKLLAKAQVTW